MGRARLTPLSADAFDLQVTIGRDTRDLLRRAQDLLGHQLPPGAVGQVLDRALRHYVRHLERRKFGAANRPRRGSRAKSKDARYIPADVRRAVAERDGGRCTYVSETGRRCDATHALEYDHIVPVARGGRSTADNLRLRCRTHNQFEAEQTYGTDFMKAKREQAQERAAAKAPRPTKATPPDPERDVTPWLRSLGFRADQARRAAQFCEGMAEATLEDRVKAALSFLAPPHRRLAVDAVPINGTGT